MAQPSNANRLTRNINARIRRAQYLDLKQLLADRGMTVNGLMNELVDAYLDAAHGRTLPGECGCPHCIAVTHQDAHFQDTLFHVA